MTQGRNGRLWLFQGRDMSRVFNNNQLCRLNQFSYEFLSLQRVTRSSAPQSTKQGHLIKARDR